MAAMHARRTATRTQRLRGPFVALALGALGACVAPPLVVQTEAPVDDPLVDVRAADPRILVDLRYATADNFAGRVLYPVDRCLLRKSAMERLSRVQTALESIGLRLKIWDAYRPWSVQKVMWELVPDPLYVADPLRGSRHNRGMAVDVTLVDLDGNELEMPTDYDEFTPAAAIDAELESDEVLLRRRMLWTSMVREGFRPLQSEWWHYDAPGWEDAPVLDVPLTEVP